MTLHAALVLLSAVFLLSGATSCLLGALGLLRLPDLPARLQAATKPQTLGLLLILLGTALQLDPAGAASLALVAIFQIITAPVISQLLGRAAYRSGAAQREFLVLDELDEQLSQDDASGR